MCQIFSSEDIMTASGTVTTESGGQWGYGDKDTPVVTPDDFWGIE